MWSLLRSSLIVVVLSTVVLGLGFPLGMTALAAVVAPRAAGGSLVIEGDRVVGSLHVGQQFDGDQWLHGRPSATPERPYNAAASSGSNLGPAHPALQARVKEAVADAHAHGVRAVPADLVTTSASGLDPHVSPGSARAQVARIAVARGVSEAQVHNAIDDATEGRFLGLFGEPRVRVLQVNLALARHRPTSG
jgi:K+-transporting ATPase ATPase C chain